MAGTPIGCHQRVELPGWADVRVMDDAIPDIGDDIIHRSRMARELEAAGDLAVESRASSGGW